MKSLEWSFSLTGRGVDAGRDTGFAPAMGPEPELANIWVFTDLNRTE